MGGVQAAVAFYKNASTPNLIIIESLLDRTDMLGDLDRLAEVCDPGTKVIAIGHVNDVLLYRELLRRGVSEYVVAPVKVLQIIESISADLHRSGDRAGRPGHRLCRRQRRLRLEHGLPQHRLCHRLVRSRATW